MPFLLILLAWPILEIALFVTVGGEIGLLPTLAIVVLTAIAGISVMRMQGMRALDRLKASMEGGGDPADAIAHDALIFVAGVLLFLPGFFTDTLGLLLLIPPVRRLVIGWGASRVTVRATTFVRPTAAARPTEVIDADYEIVDDRRSRPPGRSGWTRPDA